MWSHHLPSLPMKNWLSLLNMSYSTMINLETRSDAPTHNPGTGESVQEPQIPRSTWDTQCPGQPGLSVGILPQTHSNNNKVEKKMI